MNKNFLLKSILICLLLTGVYMSSCGSNLVYKSYKLNSWLCSSIAIIVSDCNDASRYVFVERVEIYRGYWEDIYSCQTYAFISACSSPNVVYQGLLGAYRCTDENTLNSTYQSDCTANQYLFFSSFSPIHSYKCTTIISTTTLCTSGLILYYDATNHLYSCQYLVDQCSSTTVPYAIETAVNSNDLINAFTCVTVAAMNTKCSTASYPLIFFHTDSSFYCKNQGQITLYCSLEVLKATKTISSNSFNYYRCLTNSQPISSLQANLCSPLQVFYNLLNSGVTPENYQCQSVTSTTCTLSQLLFYDSNSVYSCKLIASIVSTCAGNTASGNIYAYLALNSTISLNVYICITSGLIDIACPTTNSPTDTNALYKISTGYYKCVAKSSMNSTYSSDCISTPSNQQYLLFDGSTNPFSFYTCIKPASTSCDTANGNFLFQDVNNLYSCQTIAYIDTKCSAVSGQVMYKGQIGASSIIRCELQTTLDTCQVSGTQLWMNPSLSSSGFYNCQALTTTTCSSAITNSLMYEDKDLGIFFCKLYSQIANTCGSNKVYKYIKNGVTVYYCTTLTNIQNVLIPACQTINSLVRHNLQNTANQPQTPDNYECVLLSPGPICTSPNLIYLQTATPSIYSCLTASQIVSTCSPRKIYQKIVSSNSIFMCDALSTLHFDHIRDCSAGKRLWLSPANGNNPASYICQAIPPNPCTGSDVLYYDTVNQVYECKTITNINSLCLDAGKVDFKQTEQSTSLLYYSCQLENNLETLCTGTNLIFLDVVAKVYQCLAKAEIINTCDPDATYKKTSPITFYQCVTYSTLDSSKSSDCTSLQKLWLNPGDANNPQSYVCTAITSTQCQSQSAFMYYDVYSCLFASSITTTCLDASQIVYQWVSATDGTFYQCQALSTLNTTKSADCTSGKKLWFDEVNNPNSYVCTTIDETTCNPNSVFYDIVNGVYNCEAQSDIQTNCANKVYTWTQSNAIYYSCQTASAIGTNCPGELVFYDAIANVYSCKTKAEIINTCDPDATYKKTSPITFYQCVTYSTLDSSKSSDCTSLQKLWLNPGDANNPQSYVCTAITSTQCQSQSAFMHYDVYSCLFASSITKTCLDASQIVYQWVSATEGTFYQCQALSTLNTTKSADCTSGKKLWFDEVNNPNSYVCTTIDETTCNPNSVFYDIVNGVYNCEAQSDIQTNCANKVYTWTQSNAIYYSCQTASAIGTNCPGELVFYDAIANVYSCKTKAEIINTCDPDATYKKTSPITFYQCVTYSTLDSSKSSDCTSLQKLWLNPGDANNPQSYVCTAITSTQCQSQSAFMHYDVYSCLFASSITTTCLDASQIVYQWVSATEGTFYQCQALSTLNTTKSADCTSGKKLWFDEVNNPNSYVCTTIDETTCNPNSVFYDIVNGVYNCEAQSDIQTNCANKVYTWTQSNAIYYSCQTASAIGTNCPGELVFYDAIANVYSCKTKAEIINTCDPDATYKKTSPITFYQCVTYSTLDSSKSSDCTSLQKLWLNPGDANNPQSYVCTAITSTQCQSQSAFMHYDVYSCLFASSITTTCLDASQIVYQWVSATDGTFYQCQVLSTLNTTKSADCASGKKLWFDEVNNPNSYVCTTIDGTTCNPNSVFYDIVNGVYNCEAQSDIQTTCANKVYTWTQSNAIYYSCQTASAIGTNCPGELVFYDAIANVYSCKTKAEIINTCDPDATYKKTSPITFYQCVTYSTLDSSKSSDCTSLQKLWLNPGDANNPQSYVCTAITSTQCQSQSAFMHYDVYSCLFASSITTTCLDASQIVYQWVSATDGTFYQCQALSTLNTTKSADCKSGKKLWFDEVNNPNSYVCTTIDGTTCNPNSVFYDIVNGVYNCEAQSDIQTTCANKVYTWTQSNAIYYSCQTASAIGTNCPGELVFYDAIANVYSCKTKAEIINTCDPDATYKKTSPITFYQCVTYSTLDSSKSSDCTSLQKLWLNPGDANNPHSYVCTAITSTQCQSQSAFMHYDVYSCLFASSITTTCLDASQIVYQWVSATDGTFYQCQALSTLNTTKSADCKSGKKLWFDEVNNPNSYVCTTIDGTTCNPNSVFYDIVNGVYNCEAQSDIQTTCANKVYTWTQSNAIYYSCQTASAIGTNCPGELVFYDAIANVYSCKTKAEIINTCDPDATYKKTSPITFYQCVTYSTLDSSKSSDCTSLQKLWLNPGDANNPQSYVCTAITSTQCQSQSAFMHYDVYSCLFASSITKTCLDASQIVYQWVSATEGTFYQCQALSTLNTTKSADCTSGKKLWFDEVNNPNSYVCTTIDETTCNPNSVFYDIVNGVYNCEAQSDIQTNCANKVYTWTQSNAIYYSCQTASAIGTNCPGELVFYDAIANVYSCKTKAEIINTCDPDATYKKTSPITFYQCVTYSTLDSSKSSDCTSLQKLWLNPGDANNPQSYVCTAITSTQCQSQSAFMHYDVYSCLFASSITTTCLDASQIVYQWVSATDGTFYQCQALSTLNTTKSADCTSGKKLWFDEVNNPNSYVCTTIDETTCNPNSVFYDIVNGVYNCEAQSDIQTNCANKVYTWTQSNAIYYSCQTASAIGTNCPGELVFYDAIANVYSCKTKAEIINTCDPDATYKKTSPITFYQCVTYSTLDSSKSSDCTSLQKLWLNPGDANNPQSYVCTAITSTQCQSQSAFMHYDVYSCLFASSITTTCLDASQIVYQWVSATDGTFYQCQALSTLNTTKSADCTSGKKLWFDEVNNPNSYACTSLFLSTCTDSNLLYYDNVNFVYQCNSQTQINTLCNSNPSNPNVVSFLIGVITCYQCQTSSQCSQPGYYQFIDNLLTPPFQTCTQITSTTYGMGLYLYLDSSTEVYSCQTVVSLQTKCPSSNNALFTEFLGTTSIPFYVCSPISSLNTTYHTQCGANQILLYHANDVPQAYKCQNISPNPCSPLFTFLDLTVNLYSCITSQQLPTICQANYLQQDTNGIYSCQCTMAQITLDNSQTMCISRDISGCQVYSLPNPSDLNSLICSVCTPGTDCISNCIDYSFDNKVCLKCSNGFNPILNSKNKFICLSTAYTIPVDCTQIDQNNAIKCITCQLNYIVNYQTNKCIPIIQNCSSYSGNTCVKCQDGHILINGVCVNPPDNCFLYDQKTAQCITCLGGYLVNQRGTCSVDLSCPNLQYRDFDTNTCVYGLIPNCLTYTTIGDGLCSKCQTNYQMDSIGFSCTQIKKKIACQPNTPQYNYVVIKQNCVKVDANCAPSAYNQDGSCQFCNLGYNQVGGLCYLDKTNLQSNVDQQPQSINCASSQYLVGTNCIPIPSNCNNFNRITNICQGCSNNLIPFKNQCVSSITCPSGSYSIGTSCVSVDQNCVTFDYNNKVCSLCSTNYTPQGAQCINNAISNPCPNGRTWYNSVTELCIGISQTCNTFNKNTGECFTCMNPYVIVSPGTCGVDPSSASQSCLPGQVKIANNKCVQAVDNCKTYNQSSGDCMTCQKGYFINLKTKTCS